VGGLLAQRLGRVPLPGTEAEVAGLRLHAEGGKNRRGRMRITTVVVHACDDRIAGRRVRVTGNNTSGGDEDDDRNRSVEHA
jgi:CBS domain containing-hemolysin-like protein